MTIDELIETLATMDNDSTQIAIYEFNPGDKMEGCWFQRPWHTHANIDYQRNGWIIANWFDTRDQAIGYLFDQQIWGYRLDDVEIALVNDSMKVDAAISK